MTKSTLLRNVATPDSLQQRLHALHLIKNDLIGNRLRKEAWQNAGILQLLIDILFSTPAASARGNFEEVQSIIHAVDITGSILQDNIELLNTTESLRLYQALVQTLEASRANIVLVTATLRALDCIARTIQSQCDLGRAEDRIFGEVLYSANSLASLNHLLRQGETERNWDRQIYYVAQLLIRTCNSETRQNYVLESGILSALSSRLAREIAAYQVKSNHLRFNGFRQMRRCNFSGNNPQTQTILQATSVIIQGSDHRARCFLSMITSDLVKLNRKGSIQRHEVGIDGKLRPSAASLNPQNIELRASHTDSDKSVMYTGDVGGDTWTEVFLQWLLSLTKIDNALVRLASIWLVVLLVRCGHFSQYFGNSIAVSLVSPIIQLLQPAITCRAAVLDGSDGKIMSTDLQIVTYAPSVIAILVRDDTALQEAAFEAGLVTQLVTLLKQCNEISPQGLHRLYGIVHGGDIEGKEPLTLLSRSSASYAEAEAFKILCLGWGVRQAVLRALAAMASRKDEYRKAIIDQGALPWIVQCLKPIDRTFLKRNKRTPSIGIDFKEIGNPACVLLAACEASKTLCRSVPILRTSLSDSSLALPLAALLRYPDIGVQIAATAAVCNIVLEFSPMRQPAVDAGVMRSLCHHARSPNSKLRLNSLWALKHMMQSAPPTLKMECLDSLGPDWLKQTFEPFKSNEADYSSMRSSSWSTKGTDKELEISRVTSNIPNDLDEDHEEVHMIEEPNDPPYQTRAFGNSPHDTGLQGYVGSPIAAEDASTCQSPAQDGDLIAVREQALEFVRNLLSGHKSWEMADYMVRELGHEELPSKFADLLETSPEYQNSLDISSGGGKKAPNNLTISILYIICNFTDALPRHRQLIISSEKLLRRLLPLFRHSRADVRKICVWIVINLTWVDNEEDKFSCRSRAYELKRFGVLEELQRLSDDSDLDVRERVKNAISQMEKNLD